MTGFAVKIALIRQGNPDIISYQCLLGIASVLDIKNANCQDFLYSLLESSGV
jgi:hypothetical protein